MLMEHNTLSVYNLFSLVQIDQRFGDHNALLLDEHIALLCHLHQKDHLVYVAPLGRVNVEWTPLVHYLSFHPFPGSP